VELHDLTLYIQVAHGGDSAAVVVCVGLHCNRVPVRQLQHIAAEVGPQILDELVDGCAATD
jgi:hypothetical protein